MKDILNKKREIVVSLLTALTVFSVSMGAKWKETPDSEIQPLVVEKFLDQAKQNNDWKTAFVTGEEEQIVFMNISLSTNPNNEIGEEKHSFDQVILIVEGKGQFVADGKSQFVKNGDMIFIPKGTAHNVINMQKKDLKLISFYSDTDMPKGVTYKTKSEQPQD